MSAFLRKVIYARCIADLRWPFLWNEETLSGTEPMSR
jgi:hypothetical protein